MPLITLGAYKINDIRQEIRVAETVAHPKYNDPVRLANDIMLLRLKTEVKIGAEVETVCLPDAIHENYATLQAGESWKLEGTNHCIS